VVTRRPRSRSSRGNLGVAFVVLGAVGLIVIAVALALRPPTASRQLPNSAAPRAVDPFPNAWPDAPPADVAALLDGLGPGAQLTARWRVRGISPVIDAKIVIDVDRGDAGFRAWIVRSDRDSRLPPKRTAKFSLYTAQPRPTAEALDDAAYAEVLAALAQRIRRTETKVAVPRGM
jgi:hypothetical protein